MGYVMTLKSGAVWRLAEDGSVLFDGTRYMHFSGAGWRILGFTTRFEGRQLVTLAEAAEGKNLGQGWVHDLDHGTHRVWGMPKNQRAVKVRRETREEQGA